MPNIHFSIFIKSKRCNMGPIISCKFRPVKDKFGISQIPIAVKDLMFPNAFLHHQAVAAPILTGNIDITIIVAIQLGLLFVIGSVQMGVLVE